MSRRNQLKGYLEVLKVKYKDFKIDVDEGEYYGTRLYYMIDIFVKGNWISILAIDRERCFFVSIGLEHEEMFKTLEEVSSRVDELITNILNNVQ